MIAPTVAAVAEAVRAIADAAALPPEVKVAKQKRRELTAVGKDARRLARDLGLIRDAVDTPAERRAVARCEEWHLRLTLALPPELQPKPLPWRTP